MSTRHNVVFMGTEGTYEDDKGNKKEYGKLKFNKDGKINLACIKDYPKVYVHWDGYPSGALPILRDFLNTDGARSRMHDPEYLSAYYIGYKIIHDFGFTNLKSLDDYKSIGIATKLSDWTDFTYIVKPEKIDATKIKFVIYILSQNKKLIAKVENINDLESLEDCEWWY